MHKRKLPHGEDRFKLFNFLGGGVVGGACDGENTGKNLESIAGRSNKHGLETDSGTRSYVKPSLSYKIDKFGFPVIQPTKRNIYERVKKYYLALIEKVVKEEKNKISELENEKYEIEFPNNLIYRLLSGKDVKDVLLKDLQVEYRGGDHPNFIKRIMGQDDKLYNVFAMGIDVTQYMPDKECEKMHRKKRELANAIERYNGIKHIADEFAGGFEPKKIMPRLSKITNIFLRNSCKSQTKCLEYNSNLFCRIFIL